MKNNQFEEDTKEIKSLFPNASEEDMKNILFCCTAWPCCGWDHCMKQIRTMAERSLGDHHLAIVLAHDDVDKAMEEYSKRETDGKE